jgi:hypothetical protein
LLWDRYGPAFTFGAGAAFALLTLGVLAIVRVERRDAPQLKA